MPQRSTSSSPWRRGHPHGMKVLICNEILSRRPAIHFCPVRPLQGPCSLCPGLDPNKRTVPLYLNTQQAAARLSEPSATRANRPGCCGSGLAPEGLRRQLPWATKRAADCRRAAPFACRRAHSEPCSRASKNGGSRPPMRPRLSLRGERCRRGWVGATIGEKSSFENDAANSDAQKKC